jgi:hypothetical protein
MDMFNQFVRSADVIARDELSQEYFGEISLYQIAIKWQDLL